MSTPETPCTWTLKRVNVFAYDVIGGDRDLDLGESMEVVEKAPVDAERERLLDLLERVHDRRRTSPSVLGHEVEAALREYGRLGKEESS